MSITVQLPAELEQRLRAQTPDLEAQAKEAMLVELYRQNKLSHTELSQALGLDRLETEGVLKRHLVTDDLPTDEEYNAALARPGRADKVIVVSDTTPLNYLLLIDAIDVLPALFEQVYVPPSVIVEMTRLKTPNVVRQWGKSLLADLPVPLPIARGLSSVTLRAERSAHALASVVRYYPSPSNSNSDILNQRTARLCHVY